MNHSYWLVFQLFIFSVIGLWAQEPDLTITNNYKFEDGIYYSLESLKENKPAIPGASYISTHVINDYTYLAQVEEIKMKVDNQPIDLSGVKIICMDGIPYLQIDKALVDKRVPTFAGFVISGHLNYFFYEKIEVTEVEINAYNPLNGRPFRTGKVPKKEKRYIHQMINLNNGEIYPLTRYSVEKIIRQDTWLYDTFRRMPLELDLESLLNVIERYNQRNPLNVYK